LSSVLLEDIIEGAYVFRAEKAVDGIYELPEDSLSMAHSKLETRPWWRVDLGDVHCVWAVNILNRYGIY